MPLNAYTKWITPAILFFFFMVCLGFWSHRLRHHAATPPAPAAAPAHQ